uniref:Uncharacterized protein n=1 Tax=Heliothis virescens TaxID=7102 RepID=A0A2A4JU57_HELVI
MKWLVSSFILLVILEEYHCKPFSVGSILKRIAYGDKDHDIYLLPVYYPVPASKYPSENTYAYNRYPRYPSNYGLNHGPVYDGAWRGNSYQGQYAPPQQPTYNSYPNGSPNAMNSPYDSPSLILCSYPSSVYGNPSSTYGTPNRMNGTPYVRNGTPSQVNSTPNPTSQLAQSNIIPSELLHRSVKMI